jgi:hypothetical protein
VIWHKLTLTGGSTPAGGSFRRSPSYAISGGVVYLTGWLDSAAGPLAKFAVLPPAARPSHKIFRAIVGDGAGSSFLYINPDGTMWIYSSKPVIGSIVVSLSAVSYPAAGTAWYKLALVNGWKSAQTFYKTGDPAYTITGGVVYLSGSLRQPTGTSTEFAVLPKAARPTVEMKLTVAEFTSGTGSLLIWPSGVMRVTGSPPIRARLFTSLAAIAYPAAGTIWHKLALTNGWQTGPAAEGYPAYAILGGVVYLSGSVQRPPSSVELFQQFAYPPAAIRPANEVAAETYTFKATTGIVDITPHNQLSAAAVAERFRAGAAANPAAQPWFMLAKSQPTINSESLTSLAAISYPLSS